MATKSHNGRDAAIQKRYNKPRSVSAYINGSIYLFILSLFVTNQSIAAPRLQCENTKYDFGSVIGQDEITHEFILTNIGDEPVQISTIKNCCGTQSTIDPMEILPGSNAVCKTVFNTKNRYGVQDKQILIASNDRKNPYFELKMIGTLLRPVEYAPRLIRLGNLLPDSSLDVTITATNLLETSLTLDHAISKVPGIEAIVVESNARNWVIGLSATNPLAVGDINGQIELGFSTGSVSVPILGRVKPIVQAVPDMILLNANSSETINRLIMLRSGDNRPFEVKTAAVEGGDGTVSIVKLSASRWQLNVSLPAPRSTSSSVLITTSILAQPELILPIRVQ